MYGTYDKFFAKYLSLSFNRLINRLRFFATVPTSNCMDNILFRIKHYRSLVLDSLKSMRNEYVSTILHTSLHIMKKEFNMRPEYKIIVMKVLGKLIMQSR